MDYKEGVDKFKKMSVEEKVDQFKKLGEADKVLAYRLVLELCATHEMIEKTYEAMIAQYEKMEKTYTRFIRMRHPEIDI